MNKEIKIVAPASYAILTATQKKNIIKFFQKKGYKPTWAKNAFKKTTYLGATDKEKLADLTDAFKRNAFLIMGLRGGYGSARLLTKINWEILKKSTSLFAGFSDLTTFQNAYYTKTGKASITGILAVDAKQKPDTTLEQSFDNVVSGGAITFHGLPNYSKGKASGTLIGGNLTCFESLIGTPYIPNLKGKILLLEDVGEAPYRIDRMLTHLKNAGVFDKINGVILGDFYKCRNTGEETDDPVYNILKNFFKDFKIPVMYGLPYGHTPQHFCLPFGTKTTMDTTKKIIHIDGISKKS